MRGPCGEGSALERRPMIRFITRWCVLGLVVGTAASPALAQVPSRPRLQATPSVSSVPQGEIRGIVEDDRGQPLAGAVVSALGATTLFVTSDADGRFVFSSLAVGPYLVRAHLQGYTAARAHLVQVSAHSAIRRGPVADANRDSARRAESAHRRSWRRGADRRTGRARS